MLANHTPSRIGREWITERLTVIQPASPSSGCSCSKSGNNLWFSVRHSKSVLASNLKNEKKMQSSSIKAQDSNKNDVNNSYNNNDLPSTGHQACGWAFALWKNRMTWIYFQWLCSHGKCFPDRRIHLTHGEKIVSIYSCCDMSFISFGCVLRITPPFSSFSSSHLSLTHLPDSWRVTVVTFFSGLAVRIACLF